MADPKPFAGQVALVTGASRGIGRAIALELASHQVCVAVGYREQEAKAFEVVEAITAAGGTAVPVRGDVASEQDVKRMVSEVEQRLGPVEILVPNAGVTRDNLLGAMPLAEWDEVLNTNLRGTFLCVREVLPKMMRRRQGSIVAVSSVAATHAGRGHANYVASKGGLEAFVRSVAVELAPRSIRVNAVAPGVIETDMSNRIRAFAQDEIQKSIPLRRFGTPEEVARAVRFLASPDASYITGCVMAVTGGLGL